MLVAGAGASDPPAWGGALTFSVTVPPSWTGWSNGSVEKHIGLYYF